MQEISAPIGFPFCLLRFRESGRVVEGRRGTKEQTAEQRGAAETAGKAYENLYLC
jgi:hypothetical protein